MERKVSIVEDATGNKTVYIHNIIFKGRRKINWREVEQYLKQYIGDFHTIEENKEIIYLGSDLPDEYAHSIYTRRLRGANAKAKANAVQGLSEIIGIATDCQFIENRKEKHKSDAKYGWYSYNSRFAIPILDENGDIKNYNIFCVALLVRHSFDGKKYLYDIIKIKKETSTLFQP